MLTFFNRKELFVTFSMEKQAEIRTILNANFIDYSMKTINRNSPSPFCSMRARLGTFGQNQDITYEYIFYVKKCDYDKALYLINKK